MNYPTNEERNQALYDALAEDAELDSYENESVLDSFAGKCWCGEASTSITGKCAKHLAEDAESQAWWVH